MRTLFLLFIILISGNELFSQSVSTQLGSRAAAMGYATSGSKDTWSLFNNPGGIATIQQLSAGAAYEVQARLKYANRMGAVFYMPAQWGTSAIGMFRFGDDLYNEQVFTLGFGNELGITSLGFKINYIQYQAAGFGTSRSASIDLGGITRLSEKLLIGAYINNLTQSKIGTDKELLSTRLTAGFTYQPEKNITIASELTKELHYETTWRTGIEYSFQQKVFFRTGFNLHPNAGFFGLGIHKKKLLADYAMQFNTWKGASHQVSVVYLIHQPITK